MEVKFISRETIKPSSPTPSHSRTYNLCLFDQLAAPVYTQTLLFYSNSHKNDRNHFADRLKKSLSAALTHFYPFAGRLKDGFTIDCNDDGATFVEAQVSRDMAFALENRENVGILQLLSPCQPQIPVTGPKPDKELVIVQVNYFGCGGLAICACISHVVADASAVANFLKSWAAVSRGDDKKIAIENVIYDCSSVFPTQDVSMFFRAMSAINDKALVDSPAKVVQKRFIFDGPKIAALRKEIGYNAKVVHNSYNFPSRVEAVMGLIWEALVGVTAGGVSPIRAVSNTVNLRRRMNPPLPQCIGNVFALAMATAPTGEATNRTSLSRKIRESVKEIDDGYIRKMFADESGEWLNKKLQEMCEEFRNSNMGMFSFTSCCRVPFYETDFGWGKPTWFGTAWSLNRNGHLVDASDGEGIEAWISLTKEEMDKLQQHPAILMYATFKPSI